MREIRERAVTEASYRRAVGDSLTPAEVDRAWLLARVEEMEAALRHVHETLGHDVPWLDTIRYLRAYVEGALSPDSEP